MCVTERFTLQKQAKKNVHADNEMASISGSLSVSACLRKRVVDTTYSPELSSGFPRPVEKLPVEEENGQEEEIEEEEEANEERLVRGSVEEKMGWGVELG